MKTAFSFLSTFMAEPISIGDVFQWRLGTREMVSFLALHDCQLARLGIEVVWRIMRTLSHMTGS